MKTTIEHIKPGTKVWAIDEGAIFKGTVTEAIITVSDDVHVEYSVDIGIGPAVIFGKEDVFTSSADIKKAFHALNEAKEKPEGDDNGKWD